MIIMIVNGDSVGNVFKPYSETRSGRCRKEATAKRVRKECGLPGGASVPVLVTCNCPKCRITV